MIIQTIQNKETQPICEGLITDDTVRMLKRMFNDSDKYRYYLNTLVVMRKLMINNMSSDGINVDERHELFPILDTINELINVLEYGRATRINGLML